MDDFIEKIDKANEDYLQTLSDDKRQTLMQNARFMAESTKGLCCIYVNMSKASEEEADNIISKIIVSTLMTAYMDIDKSMHHLKIIKNRCELALSEMDKFKNKG